MQEDFDWAVDLSLIEATNRLHQDRPLDFMIHTGDSIDAGTIEELYQFVFISDRLRIPWLNLIGNHDVAIFGNYQEEVSYTLQAGVSFYPVGNVGNFVWMHRKERIISGFGRPRRQLEQHQACLGPAAAVFGRVEERQCDHPGSPSGAEPGRNVTGPAMIKGGIHAGETRQAGLHLNAEFKLYDPYFETLDFRAPN